VVRARTRSPASSWACSASVVLAVLVPGIWRTRRFDGPDSRTTACLRLGVIVAVTIVAWLAARPTRDLDHPEPSRAASSSAGPRSCRSTPRCCRARALHLVVHRRDRARQHPGGPPRPDRGRGRARTQLVHGPAAHVVLPQAFGSQPPRPATSSSTCRRTCRSAWSSPIRSCCGSPAGDRQRPTGATADLHRAGRLPRHLAGDLGDRQHRQPPTAAGGTLMAADTLRPRRPIRPSRPSITRPPERGCARTCSPTGGTPAHGDLRPDHLAWTIFSVAAVRFRQRTLGDHRRQPHQPDGRRLPPRPAAAPVGRDRDLRRRRGPVDRCHQRDAPATSPWRPADRSVPLARHRPTDGPPAALLLVIILFVRTLTPVLLLAGVVILGRGGVPGRTSAAP
jgi:hypothetical protein